MTRLFTRINFRKIIDSAVFVGVLAAFGYSLYQILSRIGLL